MIERAPAIEGSLARAVAALPDGLALDFLRGYHAIMCGCGDDKQDDWWATMLTGIRQRVAAAERDPGVIPASVYRAASLIFPVPLMHRTGECGGVCAGCEFHPESVCGEDCGGCCNEAEEAS